MASKGQKFNSYTPELKLAVVKEYLEKGTSLIKLAYHNNIASQESILQWVKKYQLHGEKAFDDKRGLATSKSAPLKGRPRKKFSSEEEKQEYETLVNERNKKKAAEKRRLASLKKKREIKKAEQLEREKSLY